jgi:O-antigen ligase
VAILAVTYLALLALGISRGLHIWLVVSVIAAFAVPASGVVLTAVTLIPPEANLVNQLPIGLFPMVAAAIGQLVRSYLRSRVIVMSLPVVALGAFGLITLASLIWVLTLTPPAPRAVPDWAVLVTGLLACLVVACDSVLARWAPLFAFGSGAAMSVFGAVAVVMPGLFEHGPLDWLIRQGVDGRAMGSTHNPNILAIVAGMSFAYFIVRAAGMKNGRARLIAALIAIASVPSLYFTFSRSAALGVGAAIIVGMILLGRRSVMLVAVLLVAGAIALGPSFIASRLDTSSGRSGGNQDQQVTDAQANSDLLRIAAWQSGIRMVIDKPLTGIGFGRYTVVKGAYGGPAELNSTHSDYIRFFAETGVPGGTAFLIFVLGIAWCLRAGREPDRAGLAAALVAFGIATQFNAQLYYLESSLPFWIAAGAAIQLHASRDRPSEPSMAIRSASPSSGDRDWYGVRPNSGRPRTAVVRRHARPMSGSGLRLSLTSRSAGSVDTDPVDERGRTRYGERSSPTAADDEKDLVD